MHPAETVDRAGEADHQAGRERGAGQSADHAVVLIDGRNASAAETAAFLDQGMSEDKS